MKGKAVGRIIDVLIKNRIVVLCISSVLLIAAIVGSVFLLISEDKLNRDLYSVFDDGTETARGLDFLSDNFGINGNAMYVVRGAETDGDLGARVAETLAIEGVHSCLWYGNITNASSFVPLVKMYAGDADIDMQPLTDYLRRLRTDGGYDYVLLYFFDENCTTISTFRILDSIDEVMGGREFASAGLTPIAYSFTTELINNFLYVVIVAVAVFLVLLFVFRQNHFDILTLGLWLLFSVALNAGIQYLLGSVFLLSFACSIAFQVIISLVFGLIFLSDYRRGRDRLGVTEALREAFTQRRWLYLALILLCVIGLSALLFVKFGFCRELGAVALRGLLLSLLSLVVLFPTLLSFVDRRVPTPRARRVVRVADRVAAFNERAHVFVFPVVVLLTGVLIVFGAFVNIDCLDVLPAEKNGDSVRAIAYEQNRQTLLVVPIELKEEGQTHSDFIEELTDLDYIAGVMSGYCALELPTDKMYQVLPVLESMDLDVTNAISAMYGLKQTPEGERRYVLYSITFPSDYSFEGEQAMLDYADTMEIVSGYFDEYYSVGMWTGAVDIDRNVRQGIRLTLLLLSILVLICVCLYLRSIIGGVFVSIAIAFGFALQICVLSWVGLGFNVVVLVMSFVLQVCCFAPQFLLVCDDWRQLDENGVYATAICATALRNGLNTYMIIDLLIVVCCASVMLICGNFVLTQFVAGVLIGALATMAAVCVILPAALTSSHRIRAALSRVIRRHIPLK